MAIDYARMQVSGPKLKAALTRAQKKDYAAVNNGSWVPACNGTETPFRSRGGHRLLYCWQPSSGRHAYINLDTDIALTDDEARATLGTY